MRDLVLRCLRQAYGQLCFVENADGGWIISIVNEDLHRDPNQFKRVIDLLNNGLPGPDGGHEVFIIYKLFIYETAAKQFAMEATFHTRASDYEGGMHTTYVDADDAYVLMREIDAEYLMLQGEVVQYQAKIVDANIEPLRLRDVNRARYVELEFNGFFIGHFEAAPSADRLPDGRIIWTITFAPQPNPVNG